METIISNTVTNLFENIPETESLPDPGNVDSVDKLKALIESLDPASHHALFVDLKRLCLFLEHQTEVLEMWLKADFRFRVLVSLLVDFFEASYADTPIDDTQLECVVPIGMAAPDLSILLEANGFSLSEDKNWVLCRALMASPTDYIDYQSPREGTEVMVNPQGVIIETVGHTSDAVH
jgi:hypothetical protein